MGIALVRISSASTLLDLVLGGGLALVEAGIILFLHNHGKELREDYVNVEDEFEAYERRTRALRASEDELAGLVEEREELQQRKEEHLTYVHDREASARQEANLVRALVASVVDGYRAGLNYNRSRLK